MRTFLFWLLLAVPCFAQVTVESTSGPVVVATSADIADLRVPDGTVVIVGDPTGGVMLVYDADSASVVNGSTVFNGPGSVGRYVTFSLAGVGGMGEGTEMWTNAEFVTGTGTAATDTAALQAAIDACEALGGGVVYISGTVPLNADITVTEPVSLVGIPGTAATIQQNDLNGTIYYNKDYSALSGATSLTATAAFADHIVVPTGTLDAGDWFFVTSEDPIVGVLHNAGYGNYPGEMHRTHEVRDTNGGNDYVIFDDFIVDALTTDPKISVISDPTIGVTVRGLTFTWAGSTSPTDATIEFRKCFDVRVQDCAWTPPCPNEVAFYYCGDIIVSDCTMGSNESYDTGAGYHVVVGAVNNMTMSDCIAYGSRHVFTTGTPSISKNATFTADAGTDLLTTTSYDLKTYDIVRFTTTGTLPTGLSANTDYLVVENTTDNFFVAASFQDLVDGTYVDITGAGTGTHTWTCTSRVGTPRNVSVNNVIAKQNGATTTTLPPFDTHAEGWGIVFQNCVCSVPTDYQDPVTPAATNVNRAFNIRARNTVIKNCTVAGSNWTNGVYVYGSDCKVLNSTFENCWFGVRLLDDSSGTGTMTGAYRLVVMGNHFSDTIDPAVSVETGSARISHNMFYNCNNQTDGLDRGIIGLKNLVAKQGTVFITHNEMTKDSNLMSITGDDTGLSTATLTRIYGNTLIGYAAADATFTADAGTDYCTSNNHTLENNHVIHVTTTTTLPAGLSTGTDYYVINKTTNTFQLSLTQGGGNIDITDAGTGTHSWSATTDSGIDLRTTTGGSGSAALQTQADTYNWTD